jgi:hypothetical protein
MNKNFSEQLSDLNERAINSLSQITELFGTPCTEYHNNIMIDVSDFSIDFKYKITKLNSDISLDENFNQFEIDFIKLDDLLFIIDSFNKRIDCIPKLRAIENIIDKLNSISVIDSKKLYSEIMAINIEQVDDFNSFGEDFSNDIRTHLNQDQYNNDYLSKIYIKVTSRALIIYNNGCSI